MKWPNQAEEEPCSQRFKVLRQEKLHSHVGREHSERANLHSPLLQTVHLKVGMRSGQSNIEHGI